MNAAPAHHTCTDRALCEAVLAGPHATLGSVPRSHVYAYVGLRGSHLGLYTSVPGARRVHEEGEVAVGEACRNLVPQAVRAPAASELGLGLGLGLGFELGLGIGC